MIQNDRKSQMDMFDQPVLAVVPWPPAPGVVTVRDHFVTTKLPHVCIQCGAEIPAGTRTRARAEVDRWDRKMVTFYFCVPCCDQMRAADA